VVGVVYNPFTGATVRTTSRQIAILFDLGLTVAGDELLVGDAARLNDFARRCTEMTPEEVTGATSHWPQRMIKTLLPILCVRTAGYCPSDVVSARLRIGISAKAAAIGVVGGTGVDSLPSTVAQLNVGQENVLQLALTGRNIFIGGTAGTGKTELIKAIRKELWKGGLRVGMTATTGLAAANIGGVTFHSAFGLSRDGEFRNMKTLSELDAVIVDEVSMLDGESLEAFDAVLRRERHSVKPFGGMQVILCGDALQLEAISRRGQMRSRLARAASQIDDSNATIDESTAAPAPSVSDASTPTTTTATSDNKPRPRLQAGHDTRFKLFFESDLFMTAFTKTMLTEQVRQANDPAFTDGLKSLRRGRWPESFDSSIKHITACTPLEKNTLLLYARNDDVQRVNEERMAAIQAEPYVFEPLPQEPKLGDGWSQSALLNVTDAFVEGSFLSNLLELMQQRCRTMRQGDITGYRYLRDGYVVRIRLPTQTDAKECNLRTSRFAEAIANVDSLSTGQAELLKMCDHETAQGLCPFSTQRALEAVLKDVPLAKRLTLKQGAQVMLRHNLTAKLINGTMGTVVDFVPAVEENLVQGIRQQSWAVPTLSAYAEQQALLHGVAMPMMPVVRFPHISEPIAIPPAPVSVGGCALTYNYEMSSLNIPLLPAYASTIHKAQGLTIRCPVRLSMDRMWPCNHIVYVAMSRVQASTQLSVSGFKKDFVVANSKAVEFDRALTPANELRLTMEDDLTDVRADWAFRLSAVELQKSPASFKAQTARTSEYVDSEAAEQIRAAQRSLQAGDRSVNTSLSKSLSDRLRKQLHRSEISAKNASTLRQQRILAARGGAPQKPSSPGAQQSPSTIPPLMLKSTPARKPNDDGKNK
jgi:hypothetical protein